MTSESSNKHFEQTRRMSLLRESATLAAQMQSR